MREGINKTYELRRLENVLTTLGTESKEASIFGIRVDGGVFVYGGVPKYGSWQ